MRSLLPRGVFSLPWVLPCRPHATDLIAHGRTETFPSFMMAETMKKLWRASKQRDLSCLRRPISTSRSVPLLTPLKPEDSEADVTHLRYAELRAIQKIWGHPVGSSANPLYVFCKGLNHKSPIVFLFRHCLVERIQTLSITKRCPVRIEYSSAEMCR
jgi:hypothetical protein